MEWHDIITAAGVVLAFFGGITIIGNGVRIIKEWIDPMAKLTERTDKLEKRADEYEAKYEHLQNIINAQSRLLIEITNHMITGNDVDKLKEKRDELTDAML